jgi:type I site-specific restriction endonuclease
MQEDTAIYIKAAKNAMDRIKRGKQPSKKTPEWVLEGLEQANMIYFANGLWHLCNDNSQYKELVTLQLQSLSNATPEGNIKVCSLGLLVDTIISQLPQWDKEILTDTFLEYRNEYPKLSLLTDLEAVS